MTHPSLQSCEHGSTRLRISNDIRLISCAKVGIISGTLSKAIEIQHLVGNDFGCQTVGYLT